VSRVPRIVAIDAVRGLALFGIFLVNFASRTVGGFRVEGSLDGLLQWLVDAFLRERVFTLFALLFGIGLAIQAANARAAGRSFLAQSMRRLGTLLLAGIVNALVVGEGEVLHVYAVCGLVALAIWMLFPRALLPVAAACWVLFALIPVWLAGAAPVPYLPTEALADASLLEQVVQRAPVIAARWTSPAWLAGRLEVLAMIVLGLWVGRRGVLRDPEAHRQVLRRVLWASGAVALVGLLWDPMCRGLSGLFSPEAVDRTLGRWSVETAATTLQRPAAALFYGLAAFLLFTRPGRHPVRDALVPLGRVALTVYILHGVVGRLYFSQSGLSLYGIRYAPGELLALATAFAFAAASAAWLRRYSFGPFEWLWRAATYLSWPPWRRRPNDPAPASGRS
jgi:uncharacterized protein